MQREGTEPSPLQDCVQFLAAGASTWAINQIQ